jgi:deoxyribonuclease-4
MTGGRHHGVKLLGTHVSTAGGVATAPQRAGELGISALAMFVKNQRRWEAKPLSEEEAAAFRAGCQEHAIDPGNVLVHAGYLINLGSPDQEVLRKSRAGFLDELQRCAQLGLTLFNFHPGGHRGEMETEACLDQIGGWINLALDQVPDVIAVLESTAGQGYNLGHTFEELAALIDRVEDKTRVGVCLDTCHTFAAGYDVRSAAGYSATMEEFERVVGLGYLKGAHVNDSKAGLGSRVDRHHTLGDGQMGLEPFRLLMNDTRFDAMPLILETLEDSTWPEQVALLAGLQD